MSIDKMFEIRALASQLNLKHIANGEIDVLYTEEAMNYMYRILYAEFSMRQDTRKKRLVKESRLPANKTFDETNIANVLVTQINNIYEFQFENYLKNIVIYGKSCTGKTSLACDIARRALSRGAKVIYTNFEELISAYETHKAPWRAIENCDVVIIDEFLYILPSEEDMIKFYRLTEFLMESRSVIVVTNRNIFDWKNLGYDEHLMNIIESRITNNAHQLHLE